MSNKKQTKAMRERERRLVMENSKHTLPNHISKTSDQFFLDALSISAFVFSSSRPYFWDAVRRSLRAWISSNLVSLERYWCLVSIGSDLIWLEATVIEILRLKLKRQNVGNLVALFLKISFLPIQGKYRRAFFMEGR